MSARLTDTLGTDCPAFSEGCPFAGGAGTQPAAKCPAFKDGCPFAGSKDVGDLGALLDVLILPSVTPRFLDAGRAPGTVPDRYTRGLDPEGAVAIEAFVREGEPQRAAASITAVSGVPDRPTRSPTTPTATPSRFSATARMARRSSAVIAVMLSTVPAMGRLSGSQVADIAPLLRRADGGSQVGTGEAQRIEDKPAAPGDPALSLNSRKSAEVQAREVID